eukprot:scaffold6193_cov123-Isochrysis_galbana.AAC.6
MGVLARGKERSGCLSPRAAGSRAAGSGLTFCAFSRSTRIPCSSDLAPLVHRRLEVWKELPHGVAGACAGGCGPDVRTRHPDQPCLCFQPLYDDAQRAAARRLLDDDIR